MTFIQDLIPAKEVASNDVSYLRQTTKTHHAAVVTGGATRHGVPEQILTDNAQGLHRPPGANGGTIDGEGVEDG